jgi:peptidoglycan/xylan/chitin deacetylase (PgdA/CDA1 family)
MERFGARSRLIAPYVRTRLGRLSTKRSGLALVYHRVGDPPGDPRYELVPALGTRAFERQLHYLRRAYRIVPLSRLLESALERRAGERFPLAITFDDDLRSHVDVVRPMLQRAGLPATFFLCGTFLDGGHSFWWEDLQVIADRREPSPLQLRSLPDLDLTAVGRRVPNAIHQAAELIERLPALQHDAVAAELRMLAGRPAPRLTASDVETLVAAGFDVGFHTRRHYLLTTLSDAELGSALTDGREALEAIVGRRLRMIAYPHGKANERVADAARSAGYEFAFTALPARVAPTTDAFMIGRMELPAVPLHDFAQIVAVTLAGDAT